MRERQTDREKVNKKFTKKKEGEKQKREIEKDRKTKKKEMFTERDEAH